MFTLLPFQSLLGALDNINNIIPRIKELLSLNDLNVLVMIIVRIPEHVFVLA